MEEKSDIEVRAPVEGEVPDENMLPSPIAMSSVNIEINELKPDLDTKTPNITSLIENCLKTIKNVKGYIYALLFALCSCMVHVIIKMSPSLDGSNHSGIRYIIQVCVMLIFIKINRLEILGPKDQRKLLLFRGCVGCAAAIVSYFSVKYLDVSDIETLTNSCVLITAILARIFLKEKLTLCHLLALVLTITGVIFIIRPRFLFGIEENLEDFFHVNLTAHAMNISKTIFDLNGTYKSIGLKTHSNRTMAETIFGVSLVLISSFCMSTSQVIVRKLCLSKVHFSVTSIYPALCGLPASIIISMLLIITKSSNIHLEDEAGILPMQFVYSFIAGLFGTAGLIFLNKALHTEDATRVGMMKTMGVFFSFILQYIMLGVEVDFLGILGALFIVSGTLSIMVIRLNEERLNNTKSCFRIFAKKI